MGRRLSPPCSPYKLNYVNPKPENLPPNWPPLYTKPIRMGFPGRGWWYQTCRPSNRLESMETFLNLVWLAVTVAAIWLWRFRWSASRANRSHSTRIQAAAMVCFVALIFPVISLTDDLHPEVIPVDASSSKRALCLLAAQHAHGSHAGTASNQQFVFTVSRGALAQVELGFAGYASHSPALNPLYRRSIRSERGPPSLA